MGNDGKAGGTLTALPRLVYLAGLGRSGTTLIERLLAELPGACSVGEVVHMWQRGVIEQERCSCGHSFGQCEFWREVGAAAFGGWAMLDVRRVTELRASVDRNRHIPRLAGPAASAVFQRNLTEYTDYYLRLYSAIGQVAACPVVVDSSKHASLAFCLRRRPELDMRVIHVVRDSRAVAYSWSRRVSRPDSNAASYMTTYSWAAAAREWNIQNGAVQLLALGGVPTLRVRYEDLVADPVATVTLMARFAGIEFSQGGLRFIGSDDSARWAELNAGHTASGNPMRFAAGRVPIIQDERWRTAMSVTQRRAVAALTFPLLVQYGYRAA